LYGADNVIDAELEFFANSNKCIDTCMNYTRPSLAVLLEPIKKAFLDAKSRGVRLRYLTEITSDNIAAAKELMNIVDELRHLDGIKGNFMVSESEYLAPLILFEKWKIASQVISSNAKEILDQHQYIFDTFWNQAVSAHQRIREIEEGLVPAKTRILYDQHEIIKEFRRLNNSASKLSICSVFGGMQIVYNYFFDSYKRIVDIYQKGKGDGVRWIIHIDKDSINLVKIFLDSGILIRHVKSMPPISFGISDKEVAITIEKMEGGKMIQSVLISNEPLYVNHFDSLFEELWKSGIDAKDRISDIEVGADLADIEVIPNPTKTREVYLELIKNAEEEILLMFPTTNAFNRQEKIGVLELAKGLKVKVRLLVPAHISTEQSLLQLRELNGYFDVRYIEQTTGAQATFLVVDRKASLVMEIKDDLKTSFDEAIGLSTYSNSKAGVLSYVAIFENLWKQTELYDDIKKAHEQLKMHDKMQKEFINVAAHELRTPIQPILGLTEVLLSQIKDVKQREMLEVAIRNAKRLQQLTNDILDVTKIEGSSLELKKEYFNLNDVVINAMNDIILGKGVLKNEKIKLSYNPQDILIRADKERISQVISNLLSNAIKFTPEGTILIRVENDENNNKINLSVKDTGQGISSTILPRLFTKFASKSYKGTGLGLFISKGIVEAHGGKIWGENNPDGKGATFSFSLPADNLA